jgi:DNA mismatch repair protein MutH
LKPPQSEAELLTRAQAIAGLKLADLAARLKEPVPDGQTRAKGWIGRLIEQALGATASSKPLPDFEAIGVELKTIPIDGRGRPRESTFITTVDVEEMHRARWEDSRVRGKLARVLWLPVDADPSQPLGARTIGEATLWSPSPRDDAIMRQDFDEIADLIAHGYADTLTAHRGRYLQIRPKARSSRARTWGLDEDGAVVPTLPRGFYLRRIFTDRVLRGRAAGRHAER